MINLRPFKYVILPISVLTAIVSSGFAQEVCSPCGQTACDAASYCQPKTTVEALKMMPVAQTQLLQQVLGSSNDLSKQLEVLDLSVEQKREIDNVVEASVDTLQGVIEQNMMNLSNDLRAYLAQLKSQVTPILNPRQRLLMEKIEAVQNAKLGLLKAQAELDILSKE